MSSTENTDCVIQLPNTPPAGGETIIPPVTLSGIPIAIDATRNNIETRGSSRELRYYVSNSLPSDVSVDDSKAQETILSEANTTVKTLIQKADKQSRIYRGISIFNTFFTIISGVVISVLNVQNSTNDNVRLASLVLGLSSATMQTLTTVFNVEKQSALAKDIYNRARSLRRTLISLKNQRHVDDLHIMPIAAEIDELSMNLFNGHNDEPLNVQK